MNIPIFNLTRQYESIEHELNNAILTTVKKGYFTLGQEVEAFERAFAAYTGARFAVGVGSGTDALTLALNALDLRPTDEIILPANSYPSAFGCAVSGLHIRLVDVDDYGNMDMTKLSGSMSTKTKVIIPVHLYGNPVDIPAMKKILRSSKKWSHIKIIEDCAQAHGAKINTKNVGSFGTIGCFSFYPSKNLGAYGDAGMIVTNDIILEKKLRALRMYGETSRYKSEIISGVSRLDELQAAVLRVKLKYLPAWNQKRRKIANRYIKELTGIGDLRFLYHSNNLLQSSNHVFVIRTKMRGKLQKFLAKHKIQTLVHYPIPIHLTPAFRHLGYKKGDFPKTEILCREVLSLPLFPELTQNEQEIVIAHIKRFYR